MHGNDTHLPYHRTGLTSSQLMSDAWLESFFEGQSAPWDSAKKDENRMKNRYGNIIAFHICPVYSQSTEVTFEIIAQTTEYHGILQDYSVSYSVSV
uniref:Uncharacterized protein n=1 Tax=Sphaerodactylus townsendi TaxID=933632 RepID=A0ACB8FD84_9SAUR